MTDALPLILGWGALVLVVVGSFILAARSRRHAAVCGSCRWRRQTWTEVGATARAGEHMRASGHSVRLYRRQ